jgi:integrase
VPQLSDVAIRAAKPRAERFTLWDDAIKGFGVRVFPGGAKTFIVLIGPGRRQSIGRYPLLSLADARTAARRILAEKTLGKVRPTHHAYDDAQNAFLKECETRLRPLTVKLYRRHLTTHFAFGRKSLGEIMPREIVTRLNRLNDRPGEKEHAYRIGRTFFEWCISQHLIERNPMQTIAKPPVGASRERVLTEDELKAVYNTALKLTSGFHRLVCLLIYTGGRRGEITALRWQNVGQEAITLPAETTKSKKTRVVPIGPSTTALLDRFPKMGEYVFPASRESKPTTTVMTGYSAAKRAFDRDCGVTGWTLHDLRRVYASGLQRLNVRLEVIEQLLGHVGSRAGIVGVYQRYGYEPEMREAVEKWERYLYALGAPMWG